MVSKQNAKHSAQWSIFQRMSEDVAQRRRDEVAASKNVVEVDVVGSGGTQQTHHQQSSSSSSRHPVAPQKKKSSRIRIRPRHPAFVMPFADLVAKLELAVKAGLVHKVVPVDEELKGVFAFIFGGKTEHADAWDQFDAVPLLARGLVLDLVEEKVLAAPFWKFFNGHEDEETVAKLLGGVGGSWGAAVGGNGEDDEIVVKVEKKEEQEEVDNDKEEEQEKQSPTKIRVLEKMDGSLGIVYFARGKWRVNTKGSFHSIQAKWGVRYLHEHYDVSKLRIGTTYLCELIYPENRIIVPYAVEKTGIWWLAAFSEVGCEYGVEELKAEVSAACASSLATSSSPFPTQYCFPSFSALADTASALPWTEEGFVVLFEEAGLRVKVKSAAYCQKVKRQTKVTAFNGVWTALKFPDGKPEGGGGKAGSTDPHYGSCPMWEMVAAGDGGGSRGGDHHKNSDADHVVEVPAAVSVGPEGRGSPESESSSEQKQQVAQQDFASLEAALEPEVLEEYYVMKTPLWAAYESHVLFLQAVRDCRRGIPRRGGIGGEEVAVDGAGGSGDCGAREEAPPPVLSTMEGKKELYGFTKKIVVLPDVLTSGEGNNSGGAPADCGGASPDEHASTKTAFLEICARFVALKKQSYAAVVDRRAEEAKTASSCDAGPLVSSSLFPIDSPLAFPSPLVSPLGRHWTELPDHLSHTKRNIAKRLRKFHGGASKSKRKEENIVEDHVVHGVDVDVPGGGFFGGAAEGGHEIMNYAPPPPLHESVLAQTPFPPSLAQGEAAGDSAEDIKSKMTVVHEALVLFNYKLVVCSCDHDVTSQNLGGSAEDDGYQHLLDTHPALKGISPRVPVFTEQHLKQLVAKGMWQAESDLPVEDYVHRGLRGFIFDALKPLENSRPFR